MEMVQISDENFNLLRDTFVEKSLVGQDVFINTTPDEMKEFQHFLKRNGPYDVVIDGLNVVHRGRRPNYDQVSLCCHRKVKEYQYSGIPVDDHLSYMTTLPRRQNFPSPKWFPL
jgi:hypothetical protein